MASTKVRSPDKTKTEGKNVFSQITTQDNQQVIERDTRTHFVNQRLLHEEVGDSELLPVLFAQPVVCSEPSANPCIAVAVQSLSLTPELS